MDNPSVNVHQIIEMVKISTGIVSTILEEKLGMKNVYAYLKVEKICYFG